MITPEEILTAPALAKALKIKLPTVRKWMAVVNMTWRRERSS